MSDDADFLKLAAVTVDYAGMSGRLAGILQWCVENDGETLFDNPRVLEQAKRALAEFHTYQGRAATRFATVERVERRHD